MVTTRAADHANGNTEAPSVAAGEKRGIEHDAADPSPDAKRVKKSDETRQTTLEETLEKNKDDAETKTAETETKSTEDKDQKNGDTEMKDSGANGHDGAESVTDAKNETEDVAVEKKKDTKAEATEEKHQTDEKMEDAPVEAEEKSKTEEVPKADEKMVDAKVDAEEKTKADEKVEDNKTETSEEKSKGDDKTEKEAKTESTEEATTADEKTEADAKVEAPEETAKNNEKTDTKQENGDSAEIPHEDKKVPSNVLEKGIVYFFFRARVNTDQPEEVDDIARSYIILRPMAPDSKLGDGPIGDAGNTRLLALPKKVFPQSGRDRFMVFVEKFGASFSELKEQFLSSGENQTQAGTSHVPAATPVGEGVYVITTTGRESHLAYMLTLPENGGEVQSELGLKEQGSFILSTKNPKFPGPANARLPQDPDFPESIKNDFRDLRWMPSKPEHLDYVNAQILMIGESDGLKNATEPRKKDVQDGKDEPKEVLEDIEEEDTKRMESLANDDSTAIFADLQARAKDYPKLKTTF